MRPITCDQCDGFGIGIKMNSKWKDRAALAEKRIESTKERVLNSEMSASIAVCTHLNGVARRCLSPPPPPRTTHNNSERKMVNTLFFCSVIYVCERFHRAIVKRFHWHCEGASASSRSVAEAHTYART